MALAIAFSIASISQPADPSRSWLARCDVEQSRDRARRY
jgi:hypothetical protein